MTNATASRTYGTVSAEWQKEMSGLEFVQGPAAGTLPLNMIAKTLGYDVVEAEKGGVVVAVEPSEDHLNPYGAVHGGLTATLLDSWMGARGAVDTRQGFRADHGRVQDFTHPAHYARNRTNQGRGRSLNSWHGRRTPHGW